MKKIVETEYLTRIFETPSAESEWFGYYNYDPLNYNQTKVLCNRSTVDGVAPQKDMTIELGYYDIEKNEWVHLGESDSWNWQQGAMLQWLPGEDGQEKVIFNCSTNNHCIAKILNTLTGEQSVINWSIYGITPDGKKSITIDMERAYWCRTYHYKSVVNNELNVPIPQDDGIFEIDLIHNTRRRIISLLDVIAIDADDNFPSLKHWLEHIMISPSGRKIAFLHRFSPINDAMQYQTRLCVSDIDGQNLCVIDGWRDYSLSHFGWQDDDHFCIYSVKIPSIQKAFLSSIKQQNTSQPASKLNKSKKSSIIISLKNCIPPQIRSLLKGGRRANFYQFYSGKGNNKYSVSYRLDGKLFNIDGHPSFTDDGRYMITDTYPDKKGYQHLIIYDTVTRKGIIVAHLFAYYKGNPASCDLHPKLCKNNDFIIIDTAYDEHHHMIMYKINWALVQQKLS